MPRQARTLLLLLPLLLAVGPASLYAQLECAQPLFEKGEIRNGLPLAHRFALVNRGSQAIAITEVRPSCGCLTPKIDKRNLQPGESAELLLEVNTLTQPAGSNTWRVTLQYQVGEEPHELSLYLNARLVTEISVEPPSLAIYTDTAISHEITVIDRRVEPLLIRAVAASSPAVRTHLGELRRDDAGRWRRTIQVEVRADCPEGRHEESLTIYTSDPLYTELKVPFTLVKHARREARATPASVVLSEPADQPLPARIVQVSTADDREVQVERIECDHPAVECRWAQGPGHQATLKIRVDRQKIPGDRMRAIVHVHLSQPTKETIDVPVSCLLH